MTRPRTHPLPSLGLQSSVLALLDTPTPSPGPQRVHSSCPSGTRPIGDTPRGTRPLPRRLQSSVPAHRDTPTPALATEPVQSPGLRRPRLGRGLHTEGAAGAGALAAPAKGPGRQQTAPQVLGPCTHLGDLRKLPAQLQAPWACVERPRGWETARSPHLICSPNKQITRKASVPAEGLPGPGPSVPRGADNRSRGRRGRCRFISEN